MPRLGITLRSGEPIDFLYYQVIIQQQVTYEFGLQEDPDASGFSVSYKLETDDPNTLVAYSAESYDLCTANACLWVDDTDTDGPNLIAHITDVQADISLSLKAHVVKNDIESTEFVEANFKLVVLPCVVSTSEPDETELSYEYTMGDGPITFGIPEYTQTPSCGFEISEITPRLFVPSDSTFFHKDSVAVLLGFGLVVNVDIIDELENQSQSWKLIAALEDGSINDEVVVTILFLKRQSDESLPDADSGRGKATQQGQGTSFNPFATQHKSGDNNTSPPPPKVSISKISSSGLVTLTFTQEMRDPRDPTYLIDPTLLLVNQTTARSLKTQNYAITVTLRPQEGNEDNIGYKGATLHAFTPTTIQIQLNFDQPEYVSSKFIADWLEIVIVKPSEFISLKGQMLEPTDLTLKEPLPRQLSEDALILDVAGSVKAGAVLFLGSALMSHPIFQLIMNQILSLISPLTNICHFTIHNLNYPANIANFFSQIMPLITFDVVPEKILTAIYGLNKAPDEPFAPQFDQLGYGGKLVITNIGSALLILFVTILGAPVLYLISWISKSILKSKSVHQYSTQKYNGLCWNGIIGFFYSQYFFFSLLGCISISYLKFGSSTTENFSSLLACLFAAFPITFAVGALWLMWYRYKPLYRLPVAPTHLNLTDAIKRLQEDYDNLYIHRKFHNYKERQNYLETYGGLIADLRLQIKGPSIFLYPIAIMVLQFSTVLVIVFLYQYPGPSLMLLCSLTLTETCLLIGIRPYEEPATQYIEVFNVFCRLALCYTLFLFTDFVSSVPAAQKIGNVFIQLALFNMIINLLIVMISVGANILKHLKRWRKRRALIKEIQRMKAKLLEQEMARVAAWKAKCKQRSATLQKTPLKTPLKKFTDDESRLRFKRGLAIFKILKESEFQINEDLLERKIRFEEDEDLELDYCPLQGKYTVETYPDADDPRILEIQNLKSDESSSEEEQEHQNDRDVSNVDQSLSELVSGVNLREKSVHKTQLVLNTIENRKPWPNVAQMKPITLESPAADVAILGDNLGDGMLEPKHWPRTNERAFFANRFDSEISAAQRQVYLNYLDSRIIILKWDMYPEFKEPELQEECRAAYETRLKETEWLNQRQSTPLMRAMIDFQIEELELQVAQKCIDSGFQWQYKAASTELQERIDYLISKMA